MSYCGHHEAGEKQMASQIPLKRGDDIGPRKKVDGLATQKVSDHRGIPSLRCNKFGGSVGSLSIYNRSPIGTIRVGRLSYTVIKL